MAGKLKHTFIYFSSGLIAVFFLIITCKSPYTVATTRWNLGAIYNPASSHFHPSYKVYHNSDLTSLLLVKLFPSELLFNQANIDGEFISKVSIQVQTYEVVDNKTTLTDSVTYYYVIKQVNAGKRFLTQIPIKTELGKHYQIRILARDMLRKDFNLKFVDVDKTSEYSEQNFNILNQNGIPYFDNVVNTGEVYKIQHRNVSNGKLFIQYYKNQSDFPKPVFAVSPDEIAFSRPDSLYIVDYNPNLFVGFTNEGLYQFRFDTNQPYGLVVLNLGKDFPKVVAVKDLIEPLAYITTSAEYKNLIDNEDKKITVDNFWLKIGGSPDRARELIRIYYNRVYFANYYFTTSRPGWKTDKGMIFIVYGPPQNMQKTANSETWIYYRQGAENSINFTFLYKPTPFSVDNFVLERSENQDWHWREAFDSWRSGEIYLSK